MAGVEIAMAAKLAGTSVAMIEAHFGKYRSAVKDKLRGVQSF